ncbi:hypothetical protein Ancab_019842 [Ancistrocladus abbreviatus]
MKYVVRTSILSTRWRHLWKSVTSLCFDSNFIEPIYGRRKRLEAESAFVRFVNTVLLLSDVLCIDKLHLQCPYIHDMASINTWIRFAIKRDVQELLVETSVEVELLRLPQMLFMSESLEVLSLKAVVLDDPGSVWLPNLTILCLNVQKYAKGESMQKIISGCPTIETLILAGWQGDEPLVVDCIPMPTLKVLYWYCNDACKFSIDAPKLEYLYIKDPGSTAFSMKNLTSLVEAYVGISSCHCDNVYKLLGGMARVKLLSLSSHALESLCAATSKSLPMFHRLTHLELDICGQSVWNFLPCLLGCSPSLEVVVLNKVRFRFLSANIVGRTVRLCPINPFVALWSPCGVPFAISSLLRVSHHQGYSHDNVACKWEKPDQVPLCLLLHLREVTMRLRTVDQFMIEVVEYFLQNAGVLEKFTIRCQNLTSRGSDEILAAWKKITTLQKARKNVFFSLLRLLAVVQLGLAGVQISTGCSSLITGLIRKVAAPSSVVLLMVDLKALISLMRSVSSVSFRADLPLL